MNEAILLLHEEARQSAEQIRWDAEEWRAALSEQRDVTAETNETLQPWQAAQQENRARCDSVGCVLLAGHGTRS
ncbi:methionyl-tRNA synthetase [Skermanella aerolata]|uniref:hypothetical protein n=1 Tax=Skermanella aerolata TaxID=393310 RepID=UPI003D19C1D7